MFQQLPFDKEWFLRLAMGSVFLYHGLSKNVNAFSKSFKLPLLVAGLVPLAEISGGSGYLLGGLDNFSDKTFLGYTITQLASLAVIPVLLGAIIMVHWKNGFNFMNNGYEFQFTLLMIALYFLFQNENQYF